MADEISQLPTLPPDETPSWLSRNRKIVIMGGSVMVLIIAALLTTMMRRPAVVNTALENIANNSVNSVVVTNTDTRRTFQRSTVTSQPQVLAPSYKAPTNDDLLNYIKNINSTIINK